MNASFQPDDFNGSEPVWLAVSRLSAGFRRMEALSEEIVTLDSVNRDICRTNAAIRRDAANAVLQTAFSLKDYRADPAKTIDAVATHDGVRPDPRPTDLWAKKLVRWADQFGRDLFGFSNGRSPAAKKSTIAPPAPKSET